MRYLTIPTILLVTGLVFAAPPNIIEEFTGKVVAQTPLASTVKQMFAAGGVPVTTVGIAGCLESGWTFRFTEARFVATNTSSRDKNITFSLRQSSKQARQVSHSDLPLP